MHPTDTTDDMQNAQLRLLAQMAPTQRVELALRLSRDLINASHRAIERAHPELSESDRRLLFIELHYGKELADEVRAAQRQCQS